MCFSNLFFILLYVQVRCPSQNLQIPFTMPTAANCQHSLNGGSEGNCNIGSPRNRKRLQDKFTIYAQSVQPKKEIPPIDYFNSDSHTLAIFDAFPKAQFHFLILPRFPFVLEEEQATKQATIKTSIESRNGISELNKNQLVTTKQKIVVPKSDLQSLSTLLASPYAKQVLNKFRKQSEFVINHIKECMRKKPIGFVVQDNQATNISGNIEWGIRLGFHAIPSMDTIHLHVISDDLVSDQVQHKMHYHKFNPKNEFWLSLEDVEDMVLNGKKVLPHTKSYYEYLLKFPLLSFRNNKIYSDMIGLKQHLEHAWLEDLNQRKAKQSKMKKVEDKEK